MTSHAASVQPEPGRFVAYLRRSLPIIEDYLTTHAPHAAAGNQHDDLERYLYGPLAEFTARGGKRTRPALCLLGCEAVWGDATRALPFACSIENFQSAALIHDDIADQGETRRGKPCVHVSDGIGIAINVGDLALVEVISDMLAHSSLPDAVTLRAISEIVRMERMTVEGQALDLGWVRDERWDITPEDYLYMAQHKTAYYSGAVPLAVGAICGGGSPEQVKALREFGMAAGLAFQLADDLLNLIGDATAQGKDFRSDITEGKRTLAVVHALTHLPEEKQGELLQILKSHTADAAKLKYAVELMQEAGSIDYVQQEAARLIATAKLKLDGAMFAKEARATLLSMADFFIERSA